MICGDVDGNIGWHASALTPRRAGGWDGRLPVPGTGEYTWNGFRDDLPFEYNPERGWIATANHNIHPAGYSPPLFFKRAPYSRFDRLNQLLGTATGLRAEDFERFQHDTSWPYVEAEKSLLRGWSSDVADVEWARQTILEWDGRYVTDSVAPSLHNHWRRNLDEEALQLGGVADQGWCRFVGTSYRYSPTRRRLASPRRERRWRRRCRRCGNHWDPTGRNGDGDG